MSRGRRTLLVLFVVLLPGAGAVLLAARLYLRSDAAARQVAQRLEAVTGGTVRIEGADIGVTGDSALRGLRLYEPGAEMAESWATAEEVRADVSAWDALRGTVLPGRLTLIGAAVTLRFDEDGNLLTRLPEGEGGSGKLPVIRVERGELTLRQRGRPDMIIRGIDAELRPDGDRLTLTGRVADRFWGDWTLDGSLARGTGAASVTLRTDRAEVTPEKLRQVAFVSPAIWDTVQPSGETSAEVTLRREAEAGTFHYRVALAPEAATVRMPPLDLQAEQVRGRVVIEDGVVYLRDVRGRALGGEIGTTADLDFRGDVDRLQFMVRADGLDVQRVPESWNLPPQFRKIRGRLGGQAEMVVTVHADGQVHTSGHGEGVITDARIAELPADPIRLRLRSDGRGFRFNPAEEPAAPEGVSVRPLSSVIVRALNGRRVGALLLTQLVAGGATLQVRQPAPKPDEKPTYLEINLGMKDVDLEQLIKGLELTLPFRVTGRLTFQIKAAMPVNAPRDLKAYRFQGTASLSRLLLADLEMEQVQSRVVYRDGVLYLEELSGRVPNATGEPGTFEGSAKLGLVPAGDLTARLTLARIPLARVLSLVPGAAEQAEGSFSGQAKLRAPAGALRDVTAWEASGRLTSQRLRAYGWTLADAGAALRLDRGVLTASALRGNLEGAKLAGAAELRLTGPFRYAGRLGLTGGDLSALGRLAPELRPPVKLAGRFAVAAEVQGTLSPLTVTATGTSSAEDARMGNVSVGSLRFRWSSNGDVLRLADMRAALYRGDLTGSAVVPLRGKEEGRVKVRFEDLDADGLTRDLPAVPVRVEGRVTGTLRGTLPPPAAQRDEVVSVTMDLTAPRLRVQGIEARRLHGTVDYRSTGLDYKLVGEALGGSFQLDGRIPPEQLRPGAPEPKEPQPEGRLRIQGAQLARLGGSFSPLRGRVDLSVDYRHSGPGLTPEGNGRLVLSGLRWGDAGPLGDLRGDVVFSKGELRLRDVTGTIGEGLVRGQVAINLRNPERSWFTVTLQGAEASRLLAPWPELASQVEGPIELRLRGNLGREWRGEGTAALERGKIAGVEVGALRLPVGFAFAPGQGRAQLTIPDTSAQVARGRVSGRATVGLGTGTRLEGFLRFHDVDLATFLRQVADSGQTASGRLSGRIDFAGSEVRSFNDVSATVDATFRQTQALQLPVLRQLTPYLAPGRSGATFQSGELRGRLAGGVFRIQQLNLEGSFLRLFAEGTVTTEGRLNLDVVANTGQLGPNPGLLRALGLRIPAVGPIPIGLLLEARNYLSNRVLYLRVTGTVRTPVVRVDPVPLLTEEAVRYFLRRANLPLLSLTAGEDR